MQTRERLLAFLEENKGRYLSGEQIAQALSVSRAAVWKAVQGLRSAGYEIDAVPHKGYSLSLQSDRLSPQGIGKYLEPACGGLAIDVLPEVDSTNTVVRARAAAGAAEGCTVLAVRQTQGRGRRGRSFFSPADTGVYLSILLRPGQAQAGRLTTMAAAAACQAIETVSGEVAQIKWVNDIFLRGRKVGGILTEAAFALEDGAVDYAVLGVGMNVYPPQDGFPAALSDIAGSVFRAPQDDGKNRMAAAFLNRFMSYYTAQQPESYVDEYRRRSLAIGRTVEVQQPGGARRATVLDVDDACRLVVRYEDGTAGRLSAGEITMRLAGEGGAPA